MTVRIGINGFGRIGKLFFKALCQHPQLQVTLINDPAADTATAAHLLNYDSTHGRWPLHAEAGPQWLAIGEHQIPYRRDKEYLPEAWSPVDIVVDCSGRIKTKADADAILARGIHKLVVSQPVDDIPNIVIGVNEHLYHSDTAAICAASCTTNCLAPVIKTLHEGLGIERGMVTTIHALTNDQCLLDANHKDLRRARSAFQSLIPTTTGVAKAINTVFPELKGKLAGMAVRAPVADVSVTDCVLEVKCDTNKDGVNQLLQDAASGPLKGILGIEFAPLVSSDFLGDPRSSIVDALSTLVVEKRLVKVLSWYDNEFGYANRLAELVKIVADDL